ncbi:hypothetical protein K4F52_004332 [Lecanicillium sp. MT-2017a]|nr:hypothetical protein K4F52_004332 [Lecanicillium sp. MT-2017a]
MVPKSPTYMRRGMNKRKRLSSSTAGLEIQEAPISERNSDPGESPIGYWDRESKWPQEYLHPTVNRLLPRRKSDALTRGRKASDSAASSSFGNQSSREEKSAPYKDPHYELLLNAKGSFLQKSDLDVTDASKILCQSLLDGEQSLPEGTVFRDEAFDYTIRNIHNKNEARILQDITRLIVPSAESLTFSDKHLRILAESVNDRWNCSLRLTGMSPQPDSAVGFAREAFTDDRLGQNGAIDWRLPW